MFHLKGISNVAILSGLLVNSCAYATFDLLGDDFDLTNFVTRPDIKAPLLNVTKHHPGHVAPGYFFTAPYVNTYQERWPKSYYQACQTGPHIYDNDGNLVWSGACAFSNRNQADFRPTIINGTWHLSGIDMGLEEAKRHEVGGGNTTGHGFIMDASYAIRTQIRAPKTIDNFNMHEFRIVDHGKSALSIIGKPEYADVSMLDDVHREAGWVKNMGFAEVDITTGKFNFQWWALDHLDLNESVIEPEHMSGPLPKAWDCFHINSVDKTADGDYLVSSKHTAAVYRISSKDGSIRWRLGGNASDFKMEGFNVSQQYDVRSLNPKDLSFKPEKSLEYISLFNQPQDTQAKHPSTPSMLIVALDPKRKTSTLIRQTPRPGSDRTDKISGGNTHFLPNGNLFASWSSNSHVTEHDPENQLVMEARFLSDRFQTYRTYKSDFRAVPSEPIAVFCAAYGTSAAKATTACWVSWNGATAEVREYRFRDGSERSDGLGPILGVAEREGFETSIQVRGYSRFVFAEALGEKGEVLGRSEKVEVYVAQPW